MLCNCWEAYDKEFSLIEVDFSDITADLNADDRTCSCSVGTSLGVGGEVFRRPWSSRTLMREAKERAVSLKWEMSAPSAWQMAERSWMASLVAAAEGGAVVP